MVTATCGIGKKGVLRDDPNGVRPRDHYDAQAKEGRNEGTLK